MLLKTASLPERVLNVVEHKGTEAPYSGEYDNFEESGTYLCKKCGLALFRSQTKFHSGCGWPSFDEEIAGAVAYKPDADGVRTEILCSRCQAHLGHVFVGENFTTNNKRHCVNSLSLDFVKDLAVTDTREAIFAAGCFWGVEHYFKQLPGVLKTEVGYTGGHTEEPHYKGVCAGDTGHYEAIRVLYDPKILSDEEVIKYFFEIHDPTQTNGQGPDLGSQYLSAIFFYDEQQKENALKLIQIIEKAGQTVATQVLPATIFWKAETYHQDYYAKTGKQPYCHQHTKRQWE
jgi:peptide methionine sulfoxide reductase msrA/msrB